MTWVVACGVACGTEAPPPPSPPPQAPRVEALRIDGSVTHVQRIALPPGSEIRVAVIETTGGESAAITVAERVIPMTHQVPVPFSLAVDPRLVSAQGRSELRAMLTDPRHTLRWITAIPVEWKPAPLTSGVLLVVAPQRAPDPVEGSSVRYRCDAAFSFGLEQRSEDVVEIRMTDRTLRMTRVPSALGVTFTDGVNTFWRKESIANLILAGKVHSCYQRYP
ncbi:MAG: YbaY family lipoprotein [Deltaproteobacteria bacterium]|nr:YbaY family lipoprotein [Deltaproteobacteria bacterium]